MAKRVLIVGNSDGIGAATTAALVARGESVVGVSRSPSSLMPPARGDESHRHEVMDVTGPAYPALLGRLVQETGPFDACIYCVGVGSELELSDLSHEAMVFEVNLTVLSSSVGAWQTWPMKRDTLSYHGYRFPTRHYQPRRLAVSPLRCELSQCRRSPGPTRHYGVLRSDPAVVPHVRFSIRSPAQASTLCAWTPASIPTGEAARPSNTGHGSRGLSSRHPQCT